MIILGGIKLKINFIFISIVGYPDNWVKRIEGIPILSFLDFESKLNKIFSISIYLFCLTPIWFPNNRFILY